MTIEQEITRPRTVLTSKQVMFEAAMLLHNFLPKGSYVVPQIVFSNPLEDGSRVVVYYDQRVNQTAGVSQPISMADLAMSVDAFNKSVLWSPMKKLAGRMTVNGTLISVEPEIPVIDGAWAERFTTARCSLLMVKLYDIVENKTILRFTTIFGEA